MCHMYLIHTPTHATPPPKRWPTFSTKRSHKYTPPVDAAPPPRCACCAPAWPFPSWQSPPSPETPQQCLQSSKPTRTNTMPSLSCHSPTPPLCSLWVKQSKRCRTVDFLQQHPPFAPNYLQTIACSRCTLVGCVTLNQIGASMSGATLPVGRWCRWRAMSTRWWWPWRVGS